MRRISTEDFDLEAFDTIGVAPVLQWIKIDTLRIDPFYQRPIDAKGRRHISIIAQNFKWSCFAPVVVSPLEGGTFTIIDGQHRTTAAAAIGIELVPCQIVIIGQQEQAAAFKAINGVTAPVSRLMLHAAAVAAREADALLVNELTSCAEVELLRYPLSADKLQPGQTIAVGAIYKCLKKYGRELTITALQCITQTNNNRSGALTGRMISAICRALNENDVWVNSGLKLLEAFDLMDLQKFHDDSAHEAPKLNIQRDVFIMREIVSALNLIAPCESVSPPGSKANGVVDHGSAVSV